MSSQVQGSHQGQGLRVAMVAARFHELIAQRLLEGAQATLARQGVRAEDTLTVWVPGAFELPLAARTLAESGRWDAVVCLGAVVRGETTHHEHVGREAAAGVAAVARETGVPVAFGVLTTENMEQAVERSGGKVGNRGADAALAAIEMVNLLRTLQDSAD